MGKEKNKIFIHALSWCGFRFLVFVSSAFSLRFCYWFASVLGALAYCVVPHRATIFEGLAIAFPAMTRKEKCGIARKVFIHMAEWSFETLYYMRHRKELCAVTLEGKEYLDAALRLGKGVVVVTAHMGNFPLMLVALAQQGYPVNILARPMRDEKTGGYVQSLRDQAGIKTILSYPRRECVVNALRALRANEIVVILSDQNFGTGGVWVNFFGKLAATPTGAVVFSMRTGAPLVPLYIFSQGYGKHCIRIQQALALAAAPNTDEAVLANTIMFTRIIEQWVRQTPSQWSWIHKRWKSRPSQESLDTPFLVEK